MKLTAIIGLECDACPKKFPFFAPPYPVTNRECESRAHGWECSDDGHVSCPECAAKEKA